MKQSFLVAISIIATLLLIISPILFINDWEKAISLGSTIVGALAGVGAIIFGFIIYDKLGIGKKIIDKRIDTVMDLLEELKIIQIKAVYYIDEEWKGIAYLRLEKGLDFDSHYNSKVDNKELGDLLVSFIPENYYSGLKKLFMILGSIWMPLELVTQLQFLSPPSMEAVNDDDKYKNTIKIIINANFDPDRNENEVFMKISGRDITYKQYYTSLQNSIFIIEKWLENNSKVPLNLNL